MVLIVWLVYKGGAKRERCKEESQGLRGHEYFHTDHTEADPELQGYSALLVQGRNVRVGCQWFFSLPFTACPSRQLSPVGLNLSGSDAAAIGCATPQV